MKKENHEKSLSQNPGWGGCIGRIRAKSVTAKCECIGDLAEADVDGAGPWLCSVVEDTFRALPAENPLPGFDALWKSVDDHRYFLVMPLAKLFSQGVVFDSLRAFADDEKSWNTIVTSSWFVALPKGTVARVPMGCLAVPLKCPPSAPEKKPAGYHNYASFWHLPFFREHAKTATAACVLAAVKKHNIDHLRGAGPGRMFKDRLDVFSKLMAAS